MSRKLVYCIVAVLIAALAGSAIVTAATTTISLFTYNWDYRSDWFRAKAAAFMAQNPDINVEIVDGGLTKFFTMAAGDAAPDILHYDAQYIPTLAARGFLLPIDDLIKRDVNTSIYIPAVFNAVKYKGKTYAFPYDIDPIGYRYNREMFQSRGLSDVNDTWTWDTLVANAKKLTLDNNGDGITDVYGFNDYWGNSLIGPTWMWQAGGEIWNADYTDTVIDTPEVARGFQMQYDVHHTYNIAPRSDDPAWAAAPWPHFQARKIAIMMETRGRISATQLDFDNGVGPVAIGPTGKHVTGITVCFLGISPQTKNVDAAWRFIKFLISREGFEAGREENRDKPVYALLSPITQQTVDMIRKDGERGGEWWLAMAQVSRVYVGRHPSGDFGFSKPSWGTVLGGVSIMDNLKEVANDLRILIQEKIDQGIKW